MNFMRVVTNITVVWKNTEDICTWSETKKKAKSRAHNYNRNKTINKQTST